MILAAESGFEEALAVLIDAKADLNVQDSAGRTAVMCAAARGHLAALPTLVAANADVHALRDKSGRTVAQLAASSVFQAVINVRSQGVPQSTPASPGGVWSSDVSPHCWHRSEALRLRPVCNVAVVSFLMFAELAMPWPASPHWHCCAAGGVGAALSGAWSEHPSVHAARESAA